MLSKFSERAPLSAAVVCLLLARVAARVMTWSSSQRRKKERRGKRVGKAFLWGLLCCLPSSRARPSLGLFLRPHTRSRASLYDTFGLIDYSVYGEVCAGDSRTCGQRQRGALPQRLLQDAFRGLSRGYPIAIVQERCALYPFLFSPLFFVMEKKN